MYTVDTDLNPIRLKDYLAIVCPVCQLPASLHATLCYKCAGPLEPAVLEKDFLAAVAGHWGHWGQGRLMLNQGGWLKDLFGNDGGLSAWFEEKAAELLLVDTCEGFFPRLISEAQDLARRFPRLADPLRVILSKITSAAREASAALARVRAASRNLTNPLEGTLMKYKETYEKIVEGLTERTGRDLDLDTCLGDIEKLVNVVNTGIKGLEGAHAKFSTLVTRMPADKVTPDLARAAAEYAAIGRAFQALVPNGG